MNGMEGMLWSKSFLKKNTLIKYIYNLPCNDQVFIIALGHICVFKSIQMKSVRTRKSHLRYWRAADGRCPDRCVWSRRWRSPRPPGSSDQRRRSGASARGERGSDPPSAAAADHQIAPRGSARSPTPDAARWTEPEPGRSLSTLRWWWPALYRNPTRRSSSSSLLDTRRDALCCWTRVTRRDRSATPPENRPGQDTPTSDEKRYVSTMLCVCMYLFS